MDKTNGIYFNISKNSCLMGDMSSIDCDFRDYLEGVLNFIYESNHMDTLRNAKNVTSEDIFNIIVSKEFNYQSKKNILHKKDGAIRAISRSIKNGLPIKLFFAVGGGYKAIIDNSNISELNYTLGLGEIFVLYQICRLEHQIKKIYPPGILFSIVIDNGVANYVNDIPIEKTEGYSALYREVISKLGKDNIIKLVVQTESLNWISESKKIVVNMVDSISEDEYNNILRFTGRKYTMEEALFSKSKYIAAMDLSAKLISNYIGDEMWFLQYSTGNSLTFRPFPGGASRIQAGDIALKKENGKVLPFLISTKNFSQYSMQKFECSEEDFLEEFLWSKLKVEMLSI